MSKAIVLGARRGSGNIGEAISDTLQICGWRVWESDCQAPAAPGHEEYNVPPLEAQADAEALVVTLGRSMVEPFHEASEADIEDVIRACLVLPLLAAKEYLTVRGYKGGTVVFIGSYAHDHPITLGTAYCAAKAGLAQATRTLAWDYTDKGYRFHIVHPYHTPGTPMWEEVQSQVVAKRGMTREEAEEYARKDLRMPEMLSPRDIGEMVAWLVDSKEGEWLSGQGLNMYGGVR